MSEPTRRAALAGLAFLVLVGLAFASDVFAATRLACQRGPAGTRCTVSCWQLGIARDTQVIADVQGAYVEDDDEGGSESRLVIEGKGGDFPVASSASWSRRRQHAAAAALTRFASVPDTQAVQFDERHSLARALLALSALAGLLWVAWPKLRPPEEEELRPPTEEHAVLDEPEPTSEPPPSPWVTRLVGVLMLRRLRYREIGEDQAASWPALAIVLLTALVVGYADGLGGSALTINGESLVPGVASANLRALAAATAALVSWPAAALTTSLLAASRGGVRTRELLRALGFANLFHMLSLLQFGGLLAWPLSFAGAYVAARGVCGAGRVRSFIATWIGQGLGLLIAIPLWLAVLTWGS